MLDVSSKAFVMLVAIQKQEEMAINLITKTKIKAQSKDPIEIQTQALVEAFIFNKVFTIIQVKYYNYNNTFLAKNKTKLSKYIKINDYVIKLEENKQPQFELIYSLEPMQLKTLKTYIKTNWANGFI